jgi:ankyrin repeat protein
MIASTKGNEQFVELLLKNPHIKIDPINKNGVNAFWLAASFGHGKIMSLLAEAGSDIFVVHKKT